MQLFPAQGEHVLDVPDAKGQTRGAHLSIRFQRLILCPPAGKQKRYDPIEVTVIHAKEESKKSGGEGIDWKLVADLPVAHLEEAVEKLRWHAMRLENRNVSQGPEVRLPGGRFQAAHGQPPDKPAGDLLHSELARILADDDGTQRVCSFSVVRLHR